MVNIVFKQFRGFNGSLESLFSTTPDITNGELKKFCFEMSDVLKKLDPKINYDGNVYTRHEGGPWWTLGYSFKYSWLNKNLQVRKGHPELFNLDNVVRTHSILYRRDPGEWSPEDKKRIRNNRFEDVFIYRPNLRVTSTEDVYDTDAMLEALESISSVSIDKDYKDAYFEDLQDLKSSPKVHARAFPISDN